MPEVVAETAPESQADEATPEGVAEAPATPVVDEATWKRRIAGKDQALTAAKQQAAELQKQLAELSDWKAQRETADMSETDKLRREIALLTEAKTAAETAAARERLARKFPLAFDLLGNDTPLDEVRLAEIEGRLSATDDEEDDEPEPRIDPNRPRRQPAAKTGPRAIAEIKGDLAAAFDREFPGYANR